MLRLFQKFAAEKFELVSRKQFVCIPLALLMGAIIGSITTVYVLKGGASHQSSADRIEPDTVTIDASIPLTQTPQAPSSSPAEVTPFTPYEELLKAECNSQNQIPFDRLPFTVSKSIKARYGLSDLAPCAFSVIPREGRDTTQDNRYGAYILMKVGADVFETLPSDNPRYTLSIGSRGSDDTGFDQGDIYEHFVNGWDPQKEATMTVRGFPIIVHLLAPGGYGMSDLGLWVEIKGYKKFGDFLAVLEAFFVMPVEGIIREKMSSLKDPQIAGPIPSGFPSMTANEKSGEFTDWFMKSYFSSYNTLSPEYKDIVDTIVTDLEGINVQ